MADRYLEIVLPAGHAERLQEVFDSGRAIWTGVNEQDQSTFHRILLPSDKVEEILDQIQSRCSGVDGFHAVVLPVAAALPVSNSEAEPETKTRQVAREELLAALSDSSHPSKVYMITVALSTIVACVGLARDSGAVVIGAMVIAPLLGPNMALALAITLGDQKLFKRSMQANLGGVSLAFAFSLLLGLILNIDPSQSEIASRSELQPSDLLLGLASGAAGAMAFTAGVSAQLVGVMVAVALLPPLATCGMLLVNGFTVEAGFAGLLLWANIVCINLAAVTVFILQKVRPRTWWEHRRSVRRSHFALLFWGASLAVALWIAWLA
jgi:uncharacterized hydrophobic protein (TIGR00341 family)